MGESTDASASLMFLKSRGLLAVRKDSRVVSMIMNPIRFLDGRLSCTHLIFDSLGVRYGLAWNSAPLRLIGLRACGMQPLCSSPGPYGTDHVNDACERKSLGSGQRTTAGTARSGSKGRGSCSLSKAERMLIVLQISHGQRSAAFSSWHDR